jgi:ribonuclease-3
MSFFQEGLGYIFQNSELLRQALTHPSYYSNKQEKPSINYFERLEFVGDRVLGLIIGDMLYHAFPDFSEGKLARRFAALVCRETLAEVARAMGIPQSLQYGRATEENHTQWATFLSDACEAVIGAVYFDGGILAATTVVNKFWANLLHQNSIFTMDPKTALQEYTQAQLKILPQYHVIKKTGPSHKPQIAVECRVKDLVVTAYGASKKMAENDCAKNMLQILKGL